VSHYVHQSDEWQAWSPDTPDHQAHFMTGKGQFDTNADSTEDYALISWASIREMVANPPTTDKSEAQWFLASSYNKPDGRCHKTQLAQGMFYALPVDIDSGNYDMEAVRKAAIKVFGQCDMVIYSSRGSTADNRKWRVIAVVEEPIPGAYYTIAQRAVISCFAEQGIETDPALARTGQLTYLPNRGEHYQHEIWDGQPSDTQAIRDRAVKLKAGEITEQEAIAKRREQREQQRLSPSEGIDGFNKAHDIVSMLERYGFTHHSGDKYVSPHSKSGKPKVRVYAHDNRASSFTGGDIDAGIGTLAKGGSVVFSSFDLFKFFEHSNDVSAALKAASRETQ
jgi:hypothetical protein